MFSVLNEIANNSHFRTTSVVMASIGSSAATYILVAITGYLSFGDKVSGNVVGMYPPGLYATIGRAAIVMLVMFSYPLQCHPCRASVDAVLKWRPKKSSSNHASSSSNTTANNISHDSTPPHLHPLLGGGNRTQEPMSDLRFSVITTSILVLSYIVAMTVSSLEAVLAYVGSTGSTSISFILPGLFYYKISSPDSPSHQRLMKENDDDDELSDDDVGVARNQPEASRSASSHDGNGDDDRAPLTESGVRGRATFRHWKRKLLRKLSLALAVYGAVVMVVCLFTNTFLASTH